MNHFHLLCGTGFFRNTKKNLISRSKTASNVTQLSKTKYKLLTSLAGNYKAIKGVFSLWMLDPPWKPGKYSVI